MAKRQQDKETADMRASFQKLIAGGLDSVSELVPRSYQGMTPMERFLVETCQINEDILDVEKGLGQSRYAVDLGSSMEAEGAGSK